MSGSSNEDNLILPINLGSPRPPDENGFLIVVLKSGSLPLGRRDLLRAAKEIGLLELAEALQDFDLTARPLITSVGAEELLQLEQIASERGFAPPHSLSNYWRLQAGSETPSLDEVEDGLRRLPEVELVYREKRGSDPVTSADYSASEHFLDAAHTGIDARWFWTQPNGDGAAMHFIDLEDGWFLAHEDLPAPTLIFNDNRDGIDFYTGDHGAAVLGVVAGVDNAKGIVGIAPNVASVRTVSSFKISQPGLVDVANALMAAAKASPMPHVVLIEVQLGIRSLPVEIESANLSAIRVAVGNGIIVVEAAGNGGNDLDSLIGADSGAILVGAGTAADPHNRSIWPNGDASNYGSRVLCYAWGDSIVSAGYGDLAGTDNQSYTSTFGGTSGASAIIAGAALLLQGMHFATTKTLLSPLQMRTLLSNPMTGTAQGGTVAGNIGVMPNLRAIVENGSSPVATERFNGKLVFERLV